jgi:hypothetical protein
VGDIHGFSRVLTFAIWFRLRQRQAPIQRQRSRDLANAQEETPDPLEVGDIALHGELKRAQSTRNTMLAA